MVRNKQPPQQLNEVQQRRAQWNLLEGPGPANPPANEQEPEPPDPPYNRQNNHLELLINDELIEDDEDDVDFIPGAIGDPGLLPRFVDRYADDDVIAIDDEDDDDDDDVIPIDDDDDAGGGDEIYIIEDYNEERRRPRRRNRRQREQLYYGNFKYVLNDCQFYAKVGMGDTATNKASRFCHFGVMKLKLRDCKSEDEIFQIPSHEFWVYVSVEMDKSAVYFEWNSGELPKKGKQKVKAKKANAVKHFMVDGLLDAELWVGLSKPKYFELKLSYFNDETSEMTIDVYFKKAGLSNLKFASDSGPCNESLGKVISYFFNIPSFSFVGEMKLKHDTEELYKAVKDFHSDKEYISFDVQHPSLIPQLRPYQKSAVKWMLHQEKFQEPKKEEEEKLHYLFTEIVCQDGTVMYYNRYGGFVVKEKFLAIAPSPGGILADEMGLGKTVEVLSCILNHPRKEVPKPEYQEPIYDEKSTGKKKRNTVSNDVYTLHQEEEDEKEGSVEASGDRNEDMENLSEKGGNRRKGRKRTGTPKSKPKKHIKVHIPKKSMEEEVTNKSGRPKRRAAKSQGGYAAYDIESDDDDEEDDYAPPEKIESEEEEEEEEEEEDYTPPEKKGKSSRRSVAKKEPPYNPDHEIAQSTFWSSIESAIINECWKGKVTDYKREGSYKEFKKYLRMKKKDPYYGMTLKERVQATYMSSLAEYSSAEFVNRRTIQGFFDLKVEQKSFFECICGSNIAEDRDKKFRVQCTVCSLWQHAECVQYDVSDPYRGVYFCPHCWTQQTPVVSEATLIVAPSSISYQWVDEIIKHLKNKALRMLVYKGVAHQGYMQPRYLGNFDIVITTYETLRSELNYVDLPHSNSELGRRFRHPKRFMATPSPLPCVEWWRVCLDEAQMVECTTTKTAEMALRLAAVNRWCVTGTPIQKSVNDLQGLLMFLGVDPYGIQQWWQQCLYVPYCHNMKSLLHNLVAQYLWRNAKKDVVHQIDIPKQEEEVHWLNFTRVEEHFYQRLHTECSYDAQQQLKKFSDPKTKLKDLDRETFNSLIHPLLKLRQACNHPQVVKGQFMSMNRKTMTMEMLLDNLIKKTKLEAEEAHRLLVASMNGMAGIHIIKEEWVQAVEVYRGVLKSIEEHSNIKTDSLQRLHTIHNLAEILNSDHPEVPPTLRDGTLKEEAESIRQRYLQHHPQQISTAEQECEANTKSTEELENKFHSDINWWLSALQSFDKEFVQEVRDEMLSSYSRFEEHKCLLYPVQSRVHLQSVLNHETKKIKTQRSDMIDGVKHLQSIDHSSMLDLAIDCHLRPTESEPPQCLLCATHDLFEDYEETLFSMKELKNSRTTLVSKETEDVKEKAQVLSATRRGHWGQSETERVLKYLQTRCLGKVESEIYEDSHTYFQALEAMKKEFKNYRILWRAIFDSVSALDEVNMATIRLRLRFPDEDLPQQKKKKNGPDLEKRIEVLRYILEPAELPQQELKLKSDQIVAKNDLRIKLGQLLYLQNLSKTDFGKADGKNPEPCPICQGDLGEKWAVLLCGHCYCMECIRALSNKGFNGLDRANVKCPMCRQTTRTKEISYVDIKAKEEEEYIKVQGSLSTKVEGIVRLMLQIKMADPEAKVLVFSSWSDVLDLIGDAFAQNCITFRALHQRSKFQRHLASFKSNSLITALLLPITSGANGLNIIEAQHVILIEPVLNPAAELQAIGRVHRIGQTKVTTVHRFLVRGTIEDRMHHILHRPDLIHTDENTVTIDDLKKLFLHPEELELQREIARNASQGNRNGVEEGISSNNQNQTNQENSVVNSIEEGVSSNDSSQESQTESREDSFYSSITRVEKLDSVSSDDTTNCPSTSRKDFLKLNNDEKGRCYSSGYETDIQASGSSAQEKNDSDIHMVAKEIFQSSDDNDTSTASFTSHDDDSLQSLSENGPLSLSSGSQDR